MATSSKARIFVAAAIWWLVAQCALAGNSRLALPVNFELFDGSYTTANRAGAFRITPRGFQWRAASTAIDLRWRHAASTSIVAEAPAGVSHYMAGPDASTWKLGVPRYARLRIPGLYAGIDAVYYGREEQLEYDLELQAGSDPDSIAFELRGHDHITLNGTGDLVARTAASELVFRRPKCHQWIGGQPRDIQCAYRVLSTTGIIGFQIESYDRTRPLVIDPVVQSLTYFGGSGFDRIYALETDASGDVVIAGVTSSANFPGTSGLPAGSATIFVAKLNPELSAIRFATAIVTRNNANPRFPIESVNGLAVDATGNIYVTGSAASTVPTTAGAWQPTGSGAFVVKLDPSGTPVYSTYLAPAVWGLSPRRLRVRNGIAYVAGNVQRPEFLGTPGALQRDVLGQSDFFAVALSEDGSRLLFATAYGGVGSEMLNDMALDPAGNIVLAGTSTSTDIATTSDALPGKPPSGTRAAALLAKIDPTGSRLLYASWLGSESVNAVTFGPEGSLTVAGSSPLDPDVIRLGPHNVIRFPVDRPSGYVMRLAPPLNSPQWTTDMQILYGAFGTGIVADPQGNLYWGEYSFWPSGGAVAAVTGYGVMKLAADGSRLLYSSAIPSETARVALSPDGSLWVAGYTSNPSLPATAGAVQPQRDPAPAGTPQAPQNTDDGFITRLDLSSFTSANFFIEPVVPVLTWRIGEAVPAPAGYAIQFGGDPMPLEAVTSTPALTATYSATPSPRILLGIDPAGATEARTSTETVIVRAPSINNSSTFMRASVRILPRVTFTVSPDRLEFRIRQGQYPPAQPIELTCDCGGESLQYSFEYSDPTWIFFSSTARIDQNRNRVDIRVGEKPPGTYDGTITIRLAGIQSVQRTVAIRYIVDPPARIQLSADVLMLLVVQREPVQPVVLQVTSDQPDVKFEMFGGFADWLRVTPSRMTTPANIEFTADSARAPAGQYAANIIFFDEIRRQTNLRLEINVVTNVPFEVLPAQIQFRWDKPRQVSPVDLSFLGRNPIGFTWSVEQPYVSPSQGSGTTPASARLTVVNTLSPGTYRTNLIARAGENAVTVPITIEITETPTLVVPTTPIRFRYRMGGPLPPPQEVRITTSNGGPLGFTASPQPGPTFIRVSPGATTAPATITVSADPEGLTPGSYNAPLLVSSSPGGLGFGAIPVGLDIEGNPNSAGPVIAVPVNSASYLPGYISPGEIVVVYGSRLGPATLVQSQLTAARQFPTTLAGTTVYFDDTPAPIIYASAGQVAVAAPFAIQSRGQTRLSVDVGGVRSESFLLRVIGYNAGVFSANASGAGNAAALNVANDGSTTLNSPANPAARNQYVTIFATGLGPVFPAMSDGSLATSPLPRLATQPRVLVGGVAAPVQYAGPAPGLIAGAMQINFLVPSTVPAGNLPLVVMTGVTNNESNSQPGITIAVR